MTSTSLSGVAASAPRPASSEGGRPLKSMALVDLLDRLLGTGVVIAGDVVISLADVDLVRIDLRLLITSVRKEMAGQ